MSGLVWPAMPVLTRENARLSPNGQRYHIAASKRYLLLPLIKEAFTLGARARCLSTVLAEH